MNFTFKEINISFAN